MASVHVFVLTAGRHTLPAGDVLPFAAAKPLNWLNATKGDPFPLESKQPAGALGKFACVNGNGFPALSVVTRLTPWPNTSSFGFTKMSWAALGLPMT